VADPKGFLTTPRQDCDRRPVGERVHDWHEVYDRRSLLPVIGGQAGRCMDCGIPFCHHGCPLGNLIPEWNDLVRRDDWAAASERLHATNNFPEFTGRLCPAPCETACVLAINQPAVTIKNIEAAIADEAWELGVVRPRPPRCPSGKSVAVIGSGPAGLACAQQLTRAGHLVTVYERADRIGGLLRYGIPEFRLEKRHLDRRLEQMRAEGTQFRAGVAVGTDLDAAELRRRNDAVVVATGATVPRELPVPGRELAGIHQAMEYLPAANHACAGDAAGRAAGSVADTAAGLAAGRPPVSAAGRHVIIVGGGDTAADCLGTALRQGASAVVQLDINPLPGPDRAPGQPWPVYPKSFRVSSAHQEARELGGLAGAEWDDWLGPEPGPDGDVRVFSAFTLGFAPDPAGRVRALRLAGTELTGTEQAGTGLAGRVPRQRRPLAGSEREVPADLVLLALGFTGPEPDSGVMEQFGLLLDEHGNFGRDEDFGGGPDGVFVAGDAGRGASLVVWAIAEGRAAAAAVDRYLTGSSTLPAPVRPADRPLTA
jgi:glutamate synthase (NADPH/NADH) small chain